MINSSNYTWQRVYSIYDLFETTSCRVSAVCRQDRRNDGPESALKNKDLFLNAKNRIQKLNWQAAGQMTTHEMTVEHNTDDGKHRA